jgi:hypothetical protein
MKSIVASAVTTREIWIFVSYLILLALIAFGTQDVRSAPEVWAVPDVWTLTVDRLIQGDIRSGDPTRFATAAVDVYETGWIRKENNWIFKLWPPGFPLIQAAVLSVFGREAPILAILQGLAVLLHASAAFALYVTLRRYINIPSALIGGLIPFAFPVTRLFLLQPTGVAFGETFAVGFFTLGMLASIAATSRPRYMLAILAGIALALAAYIRSQFEFILSVQMSVACVLVVMAILGVLRKFLGIPVPKKSLICLVVIILSTQMSMLPWRIYHLIHDGSPRWVFTTDQVTRNSVRTDAELVANKRGFVVRGGGNVVCNINPQTCGKLDQARSLYFRTFAEQPGDWLEYKARRMPAYWFAPIGTWTDVRTEPGWSDIVFNTISAVAIIASFTLVLTARSIRKDEAWLALSLFNVTLFIAYGAILVFVHFEARYLYFPKFIGLVLFLIEGAILVAHRSAKKEIAQ